MADKTNGEKKKITMTSSELKLREHKLKEKDDELQAAEKKNKEIMQEKEKLLKRLKSKAAENKEAKMERLAVDGLSSASSQLASFGVQALLDYMIEKFPDSIGAHKVALKTAPPALAAVWYLIEVLTMGQQAKFGKKWRVQASNLLTNFGFIYLGQAYREEQGSKKSDVAKLGQDNATVIAKNERLEEELNKAREKLKKAGITD